MSKNATVPYETTLLVRDNCLCLHVQRAARALARCFDDAMRPLGLTNGQFSLMMSLNRPQPPGMTSVAALLAMDRTTLTAALKPLERRGLVAVTVDLADRRGRVMALTPSGMTLLAEAVPLWKAAHGAVDARLADSDARLADSDAGRLRDDLRRISSGGVGACRRIAAEAVAP